MNRGEIGGRLGRPFRALGFISSETQGVALGFRWVAPLALNSRTSIHHPPTTPFRWVAPLALNSRTSIHHPPTTPFRWVAPLALNSRTSIHLSPSTNHQFPLVRAVGAGFLSR
jgi:hypothetical protein